MYNILAGLQLGSGDNAGGLASAEKAMQLNPGDASAAMSYTRAEIAQGNAPKAIEKWQQWTKDHPTDAQAYTVLGSLQEAQGDRNSATASYKKALAIQPEQAIAANNLAYIMMDTGQNIDVALSLAQVARRVLCQTHPTPPTPSPGPTTRRATTTRLATSSKTQPRPTRTVPPSTTTWAWPT